MQGIACQAWRAVLGSKPAPEILTEWPLKSAQQVAAQRCVPAGQVDMGLRCSTATSSMQHMTGARVAHGQDSAPQSTLTADLCCCQGRAQLGCGPRLSAPGL